MTQSVVEADRIFVGDGDRVVVRGVVVIEDGKISAVGERGGVDIPENAEYLSFPGCTVVPGLMDMHAHAMRADGDEMLVHGPKPEIVAKHILRGMAHLRRSVLNGVTTIRDLGAPHAGIFALRKAIEDRAIIGPRIFTAGRQITMTGGHGWNKAAVQVTGADEARRVARELLRDGADCLKLMVTGGAGGRVEGVYDVQLSVEEIRATVEEAHKRGKHVTAHVTGSEGIRTVLAAGVDCVEHGLDIDEAAIGDMVDRGTYFCPTLEIYEYIARPELSGYAEDLAVRSRAVIEPHKRSFRRALAAGIPMMTGTDGGDDVAREVIRMVEYGMSPAEALLAATATPATFLGIGDRLGRIADGYLADLLVVDGDPLDDITQLGHVVAVFQEGNRVGG